MWGRQLWSQVRRLMIRTGGKCCRQSWPQWRASVHRTACAGWWSSGLLRPAQLALGTQYQPHHPPYTTPPTSPGRQGCSDHSYPVLQSSALVNRGNIISVKKTVLQCMNALLLICHRQITILIRRPCDRC